MNNPMMPGIKPYALILGFYSALLQFLLLNEFLYSWGDEQWLVGFVLFSWIFLSGLGSYLARWLESLKSSLIIPGFFLLSALPLLSLFLLGLITPVPNGFIIFQILLVLSPVCLLNGILFSRLALIAGSTDAISKNYAFESAGTILAGLLIISLTKFQFHTGALLIILGILLNLFLFIGLIVKKSIAPGRIALIFLFSLTLFSFTIFNNNALAGKILAVDRIVKTPAQLLPDLEITYWIIPVILILLFIILFFRKWNTAGRAVFIAGFACMALEILIMVPLKMYFNDSQKASGIIISIFLTGMVIGYSTSLRSGFEMQNLRKMLWILALLSAFILIGFIAFWNPDEIKRWLITLFIAGGFLFSLFTGLLFSTGVQLQKGKMGKIISETYGADMMGASLGALLVSLILLLNMDFKPFLVFLTSMLLITGILFRKSN